jgi:Ca2+-binding RTX toxin-like protein
MRFSSNVHDYMSLNVLGRGSVACGEAGFVLLHQHTEVLMIKLALRRTFGAVLLSGAALALSTAAAMPAEAASTTVKISSGPVFGGNVLSVVGSSVRDVSTINGSTTSVDVSTGNVATITSGNKCSLLTSTIVRCTDITSLEVLGSSGDDELRNNTAIKMGSNGGPGNDILFGGSNKDTLNGGSGFDTADGRGGFDTCGGDEKRTSCEEVTS